LAGRQRSFADEVLICGFLASGDCAAVELQGSAIAAHKIKRRITELLLRRP
jgi:hypothetical protein